MSRRIADLLIKIGADSYEFQQKAKSVEKSLSSMEKRLSSLGKSLSLKLTAPLTALGAVAIKNADTQVQAEARLLNALDGRAEVQERLLRQASEIQSRTVIGDETIIQQQAYLASLGLTEQQIRDTTEASVQLAAATGMSLDTAVKNLAKTFGGMTGRLGESIPQLKELTKEQLQNGEAVKYVLDNYKGYTETAAKKGLGSMKQLQNAWGDFLEQVGAAMMPMLASGLTALLSPVGLVVSAVLALGAAFLYAKQQKQNLIDEMTSEFEGLSLHTLNRMLKENRRKQAVNENESPWQGQSVASKVNYALNKGKRRRELEAEEAALVAAIEKTEKAIADRAKAEAIQDQMTAALAGTSTQLKQEGGLINELNARIAELEKKKLLPSATIEDIAEYNAEIAVLKEELTRLQNITPDQLQGRKALEALPQLPAIEAPPLEVKSPDLKPFISHYAQQMSQISSLVREGLYGWADDTSEYMGENAAKTTEIVKNYCDTLVAKGYKFETALKEVYSKISEVMRSFDAQVSKFLADSIVAAAEAIGQIITGDLGFGGLMKAILTQFASFLKNIGSQLIEFGVMIIAFKSALKSVLANPWVAIGIGAAMVTAAAIMTSLINKSARENAPALAKGGLAYGATYAMVGDNPNAAVDPEVIAPLSKLKTMLPPQAIRTYASASADSSPPRDATSSMPLPRRTSLQSKSKFQTYRICNHKKSRELHVSFSLFKKCHILSLFADLIGKLLLSHSCRFSGITKYLSIVPGTSLCLERLSLGNSPWPVFLLKHILSSG